MNTTPLQVMTHARELLITVGWTQKMYARDVDGNALLPGVNLKGATCYCAMGAIRQALSTLTGIDHSHDNEAIRSQCHVALQEGMDKKQLRNGVYIYNDRYLKTQAQAIEWFDKAIKTL